MLIICFIYTYYSESETHYLPHKGPTFKTKLRLEYVIGGMGALVVMLVACLAVSLFRRSRANQVPFIPFSY